MRLRLTEIKTMHAKATGYKYSTNEVVFHVMENYTQKQRLKMLQYQWEEREAQTLCAPAG